MKIEKVIKTGKETIEITPNRYETDSSFRKVKFLNLKIVSFVDEVLVIRENNHFAKIIFESQDIRNLIKWQLGQDEYNENQRKHDDKQLIKEPEFLPVSGGTMTGPTDEGQITAKKNQEIGETLQKCYKNLLDCKKLAEEDLTSNVEDTRERAKIALKTYSTAIVLLEDIKHGRT